MKAISIRQPWAWAIIHGGKDIENRTWRTRYRGKVLIHATKTFDEEGWKWIASNKKRLSLELPDYKDYQFGGIIGVAEIVDCVDAHTSLWWTGPYGFVLANPKGLPFTPNRGMQGIYDIEFEKAVLRTLQLNGK